MAAVWKKGVRTSYGHDASAAKKAYDSNRSGSSSNSSSTSDVQTQPTVEKSDDWRKQAKFNANVNSLVRAGFDVKEAEDLSAYYFNDNVSISKGLSNSPSNAYVKKAVVATTPNINTQKLTKMESAIDKLAKEYSAKGVPKERFFQKVSRELRTSDSKVQNYLLNYSKKSAGIFGEGREQAARLSDIADTFSMLPSGVKYAIKNPTTIPMSLKQGVTGAASGTAQDFRNNPKRAATSIIVSVVLFSGVAKGASMAKVRVPSPAALIKNVSKVRVKGPIPKPVQVKVKAVESSTSIKLNTLAKDYGRTVKKYDNTYTNVHVVKKGTPRYNKAVKDMRAAKSELKKIEGKIKDTIDYKVDFERRVNKLAGKQDSSLTYAGIQKSMGKMSRSEYTEFMGNVKAGKSLEGFGLTEKALADVSKIKMEIEKPVVIKAGAKKTTVYRSETVRKVVEPSPQRTYQNPVSKINRLENELSMYCKLERSEAVPTSKIQLKYADPRSVFDAMGIKFKMPEVKADVAAKVKTSAKLKAKIATATKGVTKTKLNTAAKVRAKTATLTALRTQLKTNLKTLTQTKTQLQRKYVTVTKLKPTTKTQTAIKTATLTALKTEIATATKAIAAQKTALKAVTTTISKMPVVPKIPKVSIKSPKGKKGKGRKTSRKYTPKQFTDKVATFKQMFG